MPVMTTTATTNTQIPSYLAFNAANKSSNCAPFYYYPAPDARNVYDQPDADEIDEANECATLLPAAASTAGGEHFLTKEDNLLLERATRYASVPALGKLPKSSSYDGVSAMRSHYFHPTPTRSKNTGARLEEQANSGYVTAAPSSLCDSESSDSEYTLMLYHNNNNNNISKNAGQLHKEAYPTISLHGSAGGDSNGKLALQQTHSYAKGGSEHIMNGSAGILLSSASICNNSNSSSSSSNASSRRNTRALLRTRTTCCYRLHTFLTRNWYLSYLVPISILLALIFVAYLSRDYAKRLLFWIETQNPWVTFSLFMLFFVLVSFPVVVGYFVLMITAGYLFGCLKGFATVVLGANLGIAIAHVTIRSLRHRIPMQRLIKNETGRAILRVISGPRAFKVVLFTRLTPLPFGLQNAIFGVSSINARIYHSATFLGLLPAQAINVYLGSTLRSMHEVLNNHGTAVTGYISFVIEVICGVALMFWVVQKARKELSETLISDMSNEGKLIDIQV